MIIVDRIQLRDQIGNKMFNMNVNNRMFIVSGDNLFYTISKHSIKVYDYEKLKTLCEIRY